MVSIPVTSSTTARQPTLMGSIPRRSSTRLSVLPSTRNSVLAADRPFRLALLYQDTAFGKGVQTAVNNTITKNKLNIQLVSQQSYRMGESDFRTQLTAIKAANPDAVYLGAFPNEGAPDHHAGTAGISASTRYSSTSRTMTMPSSTRTSGSTAKEPSSRAGSRPTPHRQEQLLMPRTRSSRLLCKVRDLPGHDGRLNLRWCLHRGKGDRECRDHGQGNGETGARRSERCPRLSRR